MIPAITLKRNEDLRIRSGHLWVFSNEIHEIAGQPQPGSLVEVRDAGGRFIGSAMYNPHSLIAARIVAFDESLRGKTALDEAFFVARLERALHLRSLLFPASSTYRLVHGEADLLPGLIIDRYNDYCSVQVVSLGMEIHLPMIAGLLDAMFHPAGIAERNDTPLRELEGLPQRKGTLQGSIAPTVFDEEGVRYSINILEGQKTGFFLDQRRNRESVERFVAGKTVLDCFCNEGGFALHTAKGGAARIDAVDISRTALERAKENAAMNDFGDTINWIEADVFQFLETAAAQGKQYDMVILDPPSFTRSRKNVPAAKQGYRQIHAKALSLLSPGGILATASCSHHIFEETFQEVILDGAQKAGKRVSQLEWSGASPDHPVLPAMPETKYLKFGIFCVL